MPVATYARQGDTVDLIAWRVYEDEAMTAKILEANPGLAALGPVLPLGTRVVLPDRVVTPAPGVRLWE